MQLKILYVFISSPDRKDRRQTYGLRRLLTLTKQQSYCLILVTTISINLQCTLSIEGFTYHQHTLFSSDRGTKPPIALKNILYLLMPQNKTKIGNHEI